MLENIPYAVIIHAAMENAWQPTDRIGCKSIKGTLKV